MRTLLVAMCLLASGCSELLFDYPLAPSRSGFATGAGLEGTRQPPPASQPAPVVVDQQAIADAVAEKLAGPLSDIADALKALKPQAAPPPPPAPKVTAPPPPPKVTAPAAPAAVMWNPSRFNGHYSWQGDLRQHLLQHGYSWAQIQTWSPGQCAAMHDAAHSRACANGQCDAVRTKRKRR